MKKIKISMIALFAILCGVGLSSYTKSAAPEPFAESWFIYNVGPMDAPGSYSYSGSEPPCGGANRLCAIHVLNNGSNQPDKDALESLYQEYDAFSQPVEGVIKFKQ